MIKADNLKTFIGGVISYLGHGYTSYKVLYVPEKKLHKLNTIHNKIDKAYKAYMTRSQRAYAKKKGFANFGAVSYRNIVVILHTKGKISNEIDLGNGWEAFSKKKPVKIDISSYLDIVIFIDERGKITARLGKETLQDYKNELKEAFKTKNGYRFHKTIKRFQGLPLYRGILKQKKDTLQWVHTQQKNFGTKWYIPQYL